MKVKIELKCSLQRDLADSSLGGMTDKRGKYFTILMCGITQTAGGLVFFPQGS